MHVENIFDGWEEATKTGSFDTRQLVVDIDGFEGPLDLLLTLCRSQKVDLLKAVSYTHLTLPTSDLV